MGSEKHEWTEQPRMDTDEHGLGDRFTQDFAFANRRKKMQKGEIVEASPTGRNCRGVARKIFSVEISRNRSNWVETEGERGEPPTSTNVCSGFSIRGYGQKYFFTADHRGIPRNTADREGLTTDEHRWTRIRDIPGVRGKNFKSEWSELLGIGRNACGLSAAKRKCRGRGRERARSRKSKLNGLNR